MIHQGSTRLLSERLTGGSDLPVLRDGRVTAFPHLWQVPATTEKVAFESLLPQARKIGFDYLGFPWASLIDALRRNAAAMTCDLLRGLRGVLPPPSTFPARRATVAQHIHADHFVPFFKICGVTDLFWSHATVDTTLLDGIRVHPFPLYPAQTADDPAVADPHMPRRYLANFIGAYNPKVYLTDVRARIFDDAGSAPDVLIVKRGGWHFDRAVYSEQVKSIPPDPASLALEAQHREEYLQAIRHSAFTLCPTGSGPNSIRIGEALALASIPIILTRRLALPGDAALWEAACLFEDDSAEGYRRAMARARAMPAAELRDRQVATQALYAQVGPQAWGPLITGTVR